MAIKGLQPLSCDKPGGHVRFRLLRTPQSNAVWDMLLGRPSRYLRTVIVSVGVTDQFSLPSSVTGFHRFQLFAWTLVLGVIFCGSVYSRLAMPEFSATLLGLMGLSSGTYLGFKVPEGKREEGAAPAVPPGGGSGAV